MKKIMVVFLTILSSSVFAEVRTWEWRFLNGTAVLANVLNKEYAEASEIKVLQRVETDCLAKVEELQRDGQSVHAYRLSTEDRHLTNGGTVYTANCSIVVSEKK